MKKPIQKKSYKPRVKIIKEPTDIEFSYKDPDLLARFVTEQGSILPRIETGLTQKQQRQLAQEIKRARLLALLPYTQTF